MPRIPSVRRIVAGLRRPQVARTRAAVIIEHSIESCAGWRRNPIDIDHERMVRRALSPTRLCVRQPRTEPRGRTAIDVQSTVIHSFTEDTMDTLQKLTAASLATLALGAPCSFAAGQSSD